MIKTEKGRLRRFGRVDQMNEEVSVLRKYYVILNGGRSRGRSKKTWHDQINHIPMSVHVKNQNHIIKYIARKRRSLYKHR